jgi:hypothetical protein
MPAASSTTTMTVTLSMLVTSPKQSAPSGGRATYPRNHRQKANVQNGTTQDVTTFKHIPPWTAPTGRLVPHSVLSTGSGRRNTARRTAPEASA